MKFLDKVKNENNSRKEEEFTLEEYLNLAKKDKSVYSTPAQRMLKALGEPEIIDTNDGGKLSRLFLNRPIKNYKAFADFFGMEETIEKIVDFFRHAAQGLEESKQILYLLGPVGSSKSTLAHTIRKLYETQPFYAIKGSPVNDHPLSLFDRDKHGADLQESFGIPLNRLGTAPSGWLLKRLKELDGDITKLTVVKRFPSMQHQIASARTEPGDETNQDISSLVGKMNIRTLNKFDQNDPDAYLYSGGLNLANQGILEFVEMFKAPIKMLHPLLCATQDRMYAPTEGMSTLPFEGIILAHSNESEWTQFKEDKTNEAFIDRVYIVKVPYVLRYDAEKQILEKLIRNSDLAKAPVAPGTLEMLAKFSVLSRLEEIPNTKITLKLMAYNGESLKSKDANGKSIGEYRDLSSIDEGMSGCSTRMAFKILAKTFNFDDQEVAANPIHLLHVLRSTIKAEGYNEDLEDTLIVLVDTLEKEYVTDITREIQLCYLNSGDFCQSMFDLYFAQADAWLVDQSYLDPDTGSTLDKDALDKELTKLEGPANIQSTRAFRQDVVNFALRHKNKTGSNPAWDKHPALKEVIEKKVMINMDEMLPVLFRGHSKSKDDAEKHRSFVERMENKGYTKRQISTISEYYLRVRKS